MWAIVGLGNPGRRYSGTRHNVGFIFIKRVAREWKVKLRKRMFLSKAAVVKRNQDKVLLAMPQTYMNKIGEAMSQIIEQSEVEPEHLIVVYDDLDIPLGEIRIRKEGGAGTHKGMRSIVQEIKTTKFPRIRVGIGPLMPGDDATNYVLSPFSEEEKSPLDQGLKKALEALELTLAGAPEKAMNLYNQRVTSF